MVGGANWLNPPIHSGARPGRLTFQLPFQFEMKPPNSSLISDVGDCCERLVNANLLDQ